MSKKIVWDAIGERLYETGVDRGVVYPQVGGAYPKGEGWNGLTNVTLSPSGAEPTALYANNHKYLNLMSVEELGGTIEAYMYPPAFAACNGLKEVVPGVRAAQQKRQAFGFTFRTMIGSDTDGTNHGYKITLVWGALASPSESANATMNEDPEAKTMSWEFATTPVDMKGFDPVSSLEIDSTTVDPEKLKALEAALYGTDEADPYLPLPDEVAALVGYVAEDESTEG